MPKPLSVLFVEDSEDDAKLIAIELRRAGFEPAVVRIETAEAMREALGRQRWDVVLADYTLPSFSAPRALEIVHELGLDVPFIIVSGTVGEERAVAAMKAGAHDFLLKSSLVRLGAAIARELREAEDRRERRRAEASLALMADISKLLTDTSDYRALMRGAAELTVPALADWCVLYASGEHSIFDMVEVAHVERIDGEALRAFAGSYRPAFPPSPEERHPVAEALRTRKPVLAGELPDDEMRGMVRGDAHGALLSRLEPRSMIALPLMVRDRLRGLWIFAATMRGRYTDADVGLASDLAGRVALVAENVRLTRAREEFLSTAVHEIRTPVAVVKLTVDLLKETPPEDVQKELPRLLERLERQSDRLARLVNDVLEVSRIEVGKMGLERRPCDLAALVDRAVREVDHVSREHEIVVTQSEPITVEVDADRIEQVLTNLLSNAIKYSPEGGRVEVASRLVDGEAVVSVADRGIGIPADRQERVFEMFYRAHAGTPHARTASLGVGLFLAREFVARHGGRIWLESREGEGSTFYFSLPVRPR